MIIFVDIFTEKLYYRVNFVDKAVRKSNTSSYFSSFLFIIFPLQFLGIYQPI